MTGIYARQSVEKKDSISVETQIRMCRERCPDDEVTVYTDRGFSGKNLKRPGYLRMMRDLADGKIRRVIVYRLDRLSRSVSDFSAMWELFERHNVEFSSISEQFDTSTPIGKAMVYIIMTFAQLERETIAERITDNYYARVRSGAWPGGRAPFGFQCGRIHSGGHSIPTLTPDQNASAAAKIFSDYANTGKSLSAIARELTAAGCASAVRPAGWDSKSVSRILRSPVYARADRAVLSYYVTAGIGTVVNSEEEFDGTFSALLTGRRSAKSGAVNPPERQTLSLTNFSGIVDSATWLRCQQKLSGTLPVGTSRPGSASFLSGLLKCGTCGYAISVKRAGNRRYLCCSGRYNLHICSVRSISARPEETEYIVINEISSLIRNALRTLSGGRRRLDEIETEIENLMRRCSLAAETSMKYINRRISQLEQEKKILSRYGHLLSAPSLRLRGFGELTKDEKKEAAALLIDRIEIRGRDLDIYWKPQLTIDA